MVEGRLNKVHDRIGGWVKRCVRRWRRWDAKYLAPLPAGSWQALAPADYPFFIPLLTAFLVFGVTIGPRPGNFTVETAGLCASGLSLMLLLHAWAARSERVRAHLLAWYMALLVGLGAGLVGLSFALPETQFNPDLPTLRVHVGPPLALLLAAMLFLSGWAAGYALRRFRPEPLRTVLETAELFQPKNRSDYMGDTPAPTFCAILLLPPLRYPVQLLLPAALGVLIVRPEWVFWTGVLTLVATWLILVFGIFFDRFMEILTTLGRLFFIGPQRILSCLVIVVGLARWFQEYHVAYLFDTPTWTLPLYIAFAYALCWFYGFWCEILLARRFITLLRPDGAAETNVTYSYGGDAEVTEVKNEGRTISFHGAGRFKIEGDYEPRYRKCENISDTEKALAFLTPAEMLATFRSQLEVRKPPGGPDPLPRVRDLQRAVSAFSVWNAVMAVVFLAVPIAAGRFLTAQVPELVIAGEIASGQRLGPSLFDEARIGLKCPELGPDQPRIALAASGGGTRAALYTAAVLRGLAEKGQLCRLVLASGVSGGSAALAYLAIHQDALIVPGAPNAKAWDDFEKAMARPYIQDVLYLAAESASVFGTWRPRAGVCHEKTVAEDARERGWWPQRIGLGNLLAESFTCTMGLQTMGAVRFGLIFNTALLGEFRPTPRSPFHSLPEQARAAKGEPSRMAQMAGGRLIFTNFYVDREQSGVRYATLTDPNVSVARAAALSANFPPVFADAAIDVRNGGSDRRFWVTDGGAVENRGAVTLFMAVRDALEACGSRCAKLPDLHVIVADASAAVAPYKEGLGLGAVQGAGSKLGLALESELLRDLRAAYAQRDGIFAAHEFPMPSPLRDTIGTHWMMPNSIEMPAWKGAVELSRDEILTLLRSLFTGPATEEAPKMRQARALTIYAPAEEHEDRLNPMLYQKRWRALLSDLPSLPPMALPVTPPAAPPATGDFMISSETAPTNAAN